MVEVYMATKQTDAIARLLLKEEIEQFLYAEASLLDDRRFEEWVELFTEDVRYWMPIRRNVRFGEQERENTREGEDINWFEDTKKTLQQRVQQIMSGIHWAEEPFSRISHMLSNVQVTSATATEAVVRSNFLIYRNRVETETDFLVGKREDTLKRVGGEWKIARRAIFLDQSVLLAKNLTFFF
jgi:3-phenylpropionate/cinnamic acid dioxygenase small subunit